MSVSCLKRFLGEILRFVVQDCRVQLFQKREKVVPPIGLKRGKLGQARIGLNRGVF